MPLRLPPPTVSSPIDPVASGPFCPGSVELPGTVGACRTCPILSVYSFISGDLSLLLLIGTAFWVSSFFKVSCSLSPLVLKRLHLIGCGRLGLN